MGKQAKIRETKGKRTGYGIPKPKTPINHPQVYYKPNVSISNYQGEYGITRPVLKTLWGCGCRTYCGGS